MYMFYDKIATLLFYKFEDKKEKFITLNCKLQNDFYLPSNNSS